MRFVCDSMLGRLAKWLRILGFDCAYCREGDKGVLLRLSLAEDRTILTRDTSFVKTHAERSLHVEAEDVESQLLEVVRGFRLQLKSTPFSRCSVCNAPLQPATKSEAKGRVPFFVYQNHDRFAYCQDCNKFYWEGTHHKVMREKIARLAQSEEK